MEGIFIIAIVALVGSFMNILSESPKMFLFVVASNTLFFGSIYLMTKFY